MKNNVIEENLPLPKHLSTEWEEIFAKLILEQCFPNHFTNLDFEKERPDLRNDSYDIGIEVTSSMGEAERTLDSIYPRDFKYGNSEEKQKAKNRIEKLGGIIKDGYLIYPTMSNDLSEIFSSIENKLKKLNKKGFKKYKENDLFILGTIHIQEYKYDILKQGIETIINHFDWPRIFDKIIIYYLPGELLCFDTTTNTIKKILVNNICNLSINARNILTKKYNQS